MLNPKDVVSQAKDKQSANLNWIVIETELRQALGSGGSRRKMPKESKVMGTMEMLKSLILLLMPGIGQKADR
jgi:hypothetical protein